MGGIVDPIKEQQIQQAQEQIDFYRGLEEGFNPSSLTTLTPEQMQILGLSESDRDKLIDQHMRLQLSSGMPEGREIRYATDAERKFFDENKKYAKRAEDLIRRAQKRYEEEDNPSVDVPRWLLDFTEQPTTAKHVMDGAKEFLSKLNNIRGKREAELEDTQKYAGIMQGIREQAPQFQFDFVDESMDPFLATDVQGQLTDDQLLALQRLSEFSGVQAPEFQSGNIDDYVNISDDQINEYMGITSGLDEFLSSRPYKIL